LSSDEVSTKEEKEGRGREGKGREGKGMEGKGREGKGKGREGKGREGKGREGKGKEGKGKEWKGRAHTQRITLGAALQIGPRLSEGLYGHPRGHVEQFEPVVVFFDQVEAVPNLTDVPGGEQKEWKEKEG
jgi:hypothetical protein